MKNILNKSRIWLLSLFLIYAFIITSCGPKNNEDAPIQGTENAILTDAPNVPPPIYRNYNTKVIVNLEVKEVVKRLADGVDYTFWTFGGSVPGKFIRIKEGDMVEFHLSNHPDNKLPHNIDLHAVTGPGGGAAASFTAPGHSTQFTFRALNPGLYIYHCATAPVGMHIANGMYGLIFVQPKDGLPPVDKEFYVCQGDFYTKGKFGEPGLQAFDMEKAIHEQPDYVLFNGSVGANTGDKALRVNVGETVRLFVGNGGPNLTSAFHAIGEIFDHVYVEGGTGIINKNVQTTVIPPGGSSIVDFKCEAPGTLNLVDHAIFRTFNKGALAQIKVSGEASDKFIYSGKQNDMVYLPEGSALNSHNEIQRVEVTNLNFNERYEQGKRIFSANCIACHQIDGNGVPNAFPPLAKSDFLMADKKRAIGIVMNGFTGKVTVNGKDFNSVMPKLSLSDNDIASVITYVTNTWGNKAPITNYSDVLSIKK